MISPRDSALLLKCEDFLLHPTVRALSLAQRVDFLEKKGLSPEEITQCLKSVQRRHGLSQLAQCTAKNLSTGVATLRSKASESASQSPLLLLQFVVKKYGLATLVLALLGYGYVQFRQKKMEQMLLQHEAGRTQRKKRLHSRVEALLVVVKHQQTQYNQAAELLKARASKVLAAEEAAMNRVTASDVSSSAIRGSKLQTLQTELRELKSAIVDAVVNKDVRTTKELSMLLRPTAIDDGSTIHLCRDASFESVDALDTEAKKARQTIAKLYKSADKEQTDFRDQTNMSFNEVLALFEQGQVDEGLSTAGSYRLLFATQ